MNRVICARGHYYDGDKYENCPHCAAGAEAIEQDPFSIRHDMAASGKQGRKREKRGGFLRRRDKGAEKAESGPLIHAPKETVLLQQAEQEALQQPQEPVPPAKAPGPTACIFGPVAGVAGPAAGVSDVVAGTPVSASGVPVSVSGASGFADSISGTSVSAVSPDSEEDDDRTVGYFSTSADRTEPPAGYLVCTAGRDYGKGFPLKTGNNSIGRSVIMDVVVTDEKVSRDRQAFVLYEPIKREFYIKPGEGTGLCYLNGELVLAPSKMKAYDRILLGDTTLMLVPVCCEKFSWDGA